MNSIMSQKIKPRQQKKPRNYIAMDAILHYKGGPMRDRREKRTRNPRKSWETEQDNVF